MNKKFAAIASAVFFVAIVTLSYGADETKNEVSASKIIPSGDHSEKTADVLIDETTKAAAQKEPTTSKIIPSSDHVQKKEEAPKENAPVNSPGTTKTENTVKSVQKQTAVTTTKTTTTTTAKGATAQSNP